MVDIKKGSKCFYVGDKEEAPVAKISFLDNGTDALIVDHTSVSDALRGQNIGRQLLQKVVDLAREENKKIVPRCSFVKAVFEKTKEYEDVFSK